jgi:hypothetical protein
MVRLRILIPSIEVRILAGHPISGKLAVHKVRLPIGWRGREVWRDLRRHRPSACQYVDCDKCQHRDAPADHRQTDDDHAFDPSGVFRLRAAARSGALGVWFRRHVASSCLVHELGQDRRI